MTAWPPPPPWAAGRTGIPEPDLRVSDAERAQVADLLSKHFTEGRLDQSEHDDRVARAMAAKTRGDLAGLLDDLPPVLGPGAQPLEVVRRRRGGFALLVVTMLIFAAAFSSAMWAWHFPWLLFALIFFFVWRRAHWGWHRHRFFLCHGPGCGDPAVGPESGAPYWLAARRRRWWL